jgi:hypothetical protein
LARSGRVRSARMRCAFGATVICVVWPGLRSCGSGRGSRNLLLLFRSWWNMPVSKLALRLGTRWWRGGADHLPLGRFGKSRLPKRLRKLRPRLCVAEASVRLVNTSKSCLNQGQKLIDHKIPRDSMPTTPPFDVPTKRKYLQASRKQPGLHHRASWYLPQACGALR